MNVSAADGYMTQPKEIQTEAYAPEHRSRTSLIPGNARYAERRKQISQSILKSDPVSSCASTSRHKPVGERPIYKDADNKSAGVYQERGMAKNDLAIPLFDI